MSLKINLNFNKEFNSLDNILKDIYPSDVPSKLGATRYLEEMDMNAYQGRSYVANWNSFYSELKNLRNARNEAVHGDMESALFDDSDIEWIINFKNSILSGTDPLSILRKTKQRKVQKKPIHVNTVNVQLSKNLPKKSSKDLKWVVFFLVIIVLYLLYRMLINS